MYLVKIRIDFFEGDDCSYFRRQNNILGEIFCFSEFPFLNISVEEESDDSVVVCRFSALGPLTFVYAHTVHLNDYLWRIPLSRHHPPRLYDRLLPYLLPHRHTLLHCHLLLL